MKDTIRFASLGLAAGAVMLAIAAPATGFGGKGPLGRPGMGFAGPLGGVFEVQFGDLDTDGDGRITEAELLVRAQGRAAGMLTEADADGDGLLSAEEIAAFKHRGHHRFGGGRQGDESDPAAITVKRAKRMISARDTDGDGLLSGDELVPAAGVAALIDRFDRDDDNAWSKGEFDKAVAHSGHSGHGGHRGHGDHGGHGGHGGARRLERPQRL